MSPSSLRSIELQQILQSDSWNLHPFLPPVSAHQDDSLLQSIKRVGILHPPLLLHHSQENSYELLAGRARLHLHSELYPEQPTIACMLLEDTAAPLSILFHILEDQKLSGPLSPMEKAFFFSYCLQHLSTEDAARHFLPALGEKNQPQTITRYIRLLELEPELQRSVHSLKIAEKTAFELLLLSRSERLALHTLFIQLGLGGGKQKRLLSLARDLACRHGKTITELFSEKELKDILTHPESNVPQKAAILFRFLQKQLFPNSEAAEEAFRKNVARIRLPGSCSIEHSQSFETDEVSLRIRFSSLEDLVKRKEEIRGLGGN